MTSDEWHDVLTLLTIVILADRRVYKEEVDSFVDTIKSLNAEISPEIFMTDGMAFDWFKSNRDRVSNLLIGPNVDKTIKTIIARTRHIAGKTSVISAMNKIANADSDFHKSEQNIIKRTAYGWGVPYS